MILLALAAWSAAIQPALAALHPGDILDIVIFDHPELSGPATVSKDGFVSVPLIGRVAAAGAEPDGLARRIRLALGPWQVDPAVDDLFDDLGSRSFFGGYDASSDRGAAFVVESRGAGSINVLLRLPQLNEQCVSCRTVHFYYHAT